MPALKPNKSVEQRSPELKVTNRLKPGKHRFLLSVVDDSGNESRPAELTVTVTAGSVTDRNLIRDRERFRRINTDRIIRR